MSGTRFLKMNYSDINRAEASIVIDNNNAEVESLINRDPFWVWQSIGSNDDTDTVTLTASFGVARTMDTLLLINHNLKNFSFEYWNGAVWIEILAETANVEDVYFSKFTPVSTDQVRLIMNSTIVADSEKTIQDFIATGQLGQFAGYPEVELTDTTDRVKKRMLSGKEKITISGPQVKANIRFKDYTGNTDRTLVNTLRELREEFLIWPSGGDASQFAHNDIGYRLSDIYLVTIDKGFRHKFTKGLFKSGMSGNLIFTEVA